MLGSITPRDLAWTISNSRDMAYLDSLEFVLSYVNQFVDNSDLFTNDVPRHPHDDKNDLGDGLLTNRGQEIIWNCLKAKEFFETFPQKRSRPTKENTMTFESALSALLKGKKVTRPGWFVADGTEINHIKIRKACAECRTTEELVYLAVGGDGKYHPFCFGSSEIAQNDWMVL